MTGKLTTFFQIRPGEGRLVALLIALFLLPSMGGAVGSPSVEALFYARFGVEYLPFMYIAVGLTTLVVALSLGGLLGRLSKKRLYRALPPFLALTLVISRLLVGLDLNWFYPVLWLWMSLLWTLQALFTWGLAGMVCDTRQAKRLFPLFGAGGILGIALGGYITPPLVAGIGTENLLLVWAGMLLLTLVIVVPLLRDEVEPKRSAWQAPPGVLAEVEKGLAQVRRTPLLRWIALAAALFSLLFFTVAFPFSKVVAAQFPDEDALTSFLGIFQGVTTTVAFGTSLFLANRFYARFGFMTALLTFPLIYLLGFGLMLVLGAPFTALVGFRFAQMAWLQGLADTAYQGVFNIVPASHREQTRTFIRGGPEQLGVVLTGVLLALGAEALQDWHLFVIGMGVALATSLAIWRAGRAYRAALADALRAGQPHVFVSEEAPFGGLRKDAAAVQTAVACMRDANPAIRALAAEILGELGEPAGIPPLLTALDDSDPDVRAAALTALADAGAAAALLEIAASLHDEAAEVRLAAVTALTGLAPPRRGLRLHLTPLLADDAPRVRARAAASLLALGEESAAERALAEMAAAEALEMRLAALEAMPYWGGATCFTFVTAAVRDSQPAVRLAAVRALALLDDVPRMDIYFQLLADDDAAVRAAAAAAIAARGGAARPRLLNALQDPAREAGALQALAHMPPPPAAAVRGYARDKVAQAAYFAAQARALAAPADDRPRLALLARALGGAARYQATLALRAIGLQDDPAVMTMTLENLNSRNAVQRSNALEMLEALPHREILQPVVSLWDPAALSPATPPTGDDGAAMVLMTILKEPDPWLRACAALAVADLSTPALQAELTQIAANVADALLTATADYVLSGARMDTLATIPIMERILYLQKVRLFESLAPAELKQIAAITQEHLFNDGDIIARQDEPGNEMYIIVTGRVGVVVRGEDGLEKEILVRQPGDYVGEMSIISHEPRMATLVAYGAVRALCLGQEHFASMLRERPEISLAVMRELIARLREQSG